MFTFPNNFFRDPWLRLFCLATSLTEKILCVFPLSRYSYCFIGSINDVGCKFLINGNEVRRLIFFPDVSSFFTQPIQTVRDGHFFDCRVFYFCFHRILVLSTSRKKQPAEKNKNWFHISPHLFLRNLSIALRTSSATLRSSFLDNFLSAAICGSVR